MSEDLKKEVVRRIVEAGRPIKIILFGSYAHGREESSSDLDLLIVKADFTSKLQEAMKIRSALKDVPVAKDILVVNEDEYDFYKNEACSVIKEAHDHGVVLYG